MIGMWVNQFPAIDCVPLFLGRRVVDIHISVTPAVVGGER
jgi:hypothetical protein